MATSHLTLERIKALLVPMNDQSIAANKVFYTPNPCLIAQELATWEATNGITLPEAYRLFLLEIGNGGTMPGSYSNFVIKRLDSNAVDSSLRGPFPITKERFERQMASPQRAGDEGNPYLFPELNPSWEKGLPPGCLEVGRYPSYDMVFLVVTGELRGTVWNNVYQGVPEIDRQRKPFDFLSWFEDTLLELMESE